MNRPIIAILCVIGTCLIAYAIHSYKTSLLDVDANNKPDYTRRLIRWAKQYQSVQPEDLEHIQDATTMKQLFSALQKVPTCRSAKLIAYLYFSIYVERDASALRSFVDLMKEYYPDPYQWENAMKWKHANHLVWSTYDTLSNDTSNKKKKNTSCLKNFKAVLSSTKDTKKETK